MADEKQIPETTTAPQTPAPKATKAAPVPELTEYSVTFTFGGAKKTAKVRAESPSAAFKKAKADYLAAYQEEAEKLAAEQV